MRTPGPVGSSFMSSVNQVTHVVDSVVLVSKEIMLQHDFTKQPAASICHELLIVNNEMNALGSEMMKDVPSKALKQKIASCSYEIARFVKELLNLLENE